MSEAVNTDRRHAGWRFAAAAILALGAAGCGNGEIGITRVRDKGNPVRVGLKTADRFATSSRRQDPDVNEIAEMLQWRVPEGWEQLPPKPLRVINLRAGEAECYLTFLTGGTAASNINRWRGQLGLPPADTEGIAKLQIEERMLMGRTYRLELSGAYQGKAGQRMRATYAQFPQFAVSVKMVGPEAAVQAAQAGFDEFVASLAWRDAGQEPAKGQAQPTLKWDVPEGWTKGDGHAMRYVTYNAGKAECFITFLGPEASDWKMNVVRWVGDIGIPMPDDASLAALPKITLLNKESPMLEAVGATKAMLGVMAKLPAGTMFVKLTGPPAEIQAQKSSFVAFCKSLRMEK